MTGAQSLSVLYVDDDRDIRRIVSLAMSLDAQIDLRAAESGAEALALLQQDAWRPDVVLLDVMMPGLNGPTTMRRMREEHGLQGTPFIFITAMGREAEVTGYRELGATGVVLKPFDPITLASRIRAMIDR